MNGAEIVEAALHREPELLRSLLYQLADIELTGELGQLDGLPLLAFRVERGWLAVVVLDGIDEARRRSWLAALVEIGQRTGEAGDLLVVTSNKRVARWARRPLRQTGGLGTRVSLAPVVIQVGLDEAEQIVQGPSPQAALVAAWAVQRKVGPRSLAVAQAALVFLDEVAEPDRGWWLDASLQLLNTTQLAHLQTMTRDMPRSEAFAQFCSSLEERAEARGKARALLRFLEARGVPLSPEQRTHIEQQGDLSVVSMWLDRVYPAASTGEMLEAIFGPTSG